MRLPQRDSATGRAIFTGLQTLVAVVLAVVTNEDVTYLVTEHYPEIVPTVAFIAGIVSFVNNYLRSNVENY